MYVEAPAPIPARGRCVFLAGGITGCPDWQAEAAAALGDLNVVLLNPRREATPWRGDAAEQIGWEYHGPRRADLVLFWFPASRSVQPISLYELGVHAAGRKPIVVGVIAVPAVERRPEHIHTQSASGAWLAIAVAPVVWLVVIVAGLASGENAAGSPVLASAWASLVSAVLLVATFVFLPVLVISMGLGWIIALVVVAVTLGLLEWRSRRKPSS